MGVCIDNTMVVWWFKRTIFYFYPPLRYLTASYSAANNKITTSEIIFLIEVSVCFKIGINHTSIFQGWINK